MLPTTAILFVKRVDKAAFLQLFRQRSIDELLRLRQRFLTLKLVFDEELNCLQRRPRALLQSWRVVLPRSLENFIVADLAILGQDFLAELLIGTVAVHAARKGAQKTQRDIMVLSEKSPRRDDRAVDVLDAEFAEIHQLAHAKLRGFGVE